MRKVDDGEKKKEKKIMTFIVATNVVASRPPERRPTGTPHARAKIQEQKRCTKQCKKVFKRSDQNVYGSFKLLIYITKTLLSFVFAEWSVRCYFLHLINGPL